MSDDNYQGGRRLSFPLVKRGKNYENALQSRSQSILNSLQNLLASNYQDTIASTEYATYLRSMALELGKITLALEELQEDIAFEDVRSEFLYNSLGYILFLNKKLPDLEWSDEKFRDFLLKIVEIYFQGATPESIREAVELFSDDSFEVEERFQDPMPDISEQFGFSISFDLNNAFPQDFFRVQANINLLVDIIKPAHTLYEIRNVFSESYDTADTVQDTSEWELFNYYYDDVRKYCQGLAGFESSTGEITAGSLDVLTDTDSTKPLTSVQPTAQLVVLEGNNKGFYSVLDTTTSGIRIEPSFVEVESNVPYKVEIDRLGFKKEIQVTGERVRQPDVVYGTFSARVGVSMDVLDNRVDGPTWTTNLTSSTQINSDRGIAGSAGVSVTSGTVLDGERSRTADASSSVSTTLQADGEVT